MAKKINAENGPRFVPDGTPHSGLTPADSLNERIRELADVARITQGPVSWTPDRLTPQQLEGLSARRGVSVDGQTIYVSPKAK